MAQYVSDANKQPSGWAQSLDQFWSHHRTAATRLLSVVAIAGVWEWSVRVGGINPLFLSSPSMILARLVTVLGNGSILPHILVTGETALVGFVISIAIGVPVGILMGRVRLARDVIEPIVMAQYSSPTVAFLPLLIMWLGLGLWSEVVLVVLGGIFVIIINTEAGVANTDRRLIETAHSFCASQSQILWHIVLPSALPFIIAGLRLAIGRTLIMVVVAEMYASTAGLGYLIFQAAAAFDTTLVFVGVVILAAAGVVLNSVMRSLEERIAPWMMGQRD